MDLTKIKSVLSDFQIEHFHVFHTITSLKWETIFDYESWNEHKSLFLTMISSDNYKIVMEFIDVNSLHIQGNGQISGFYIKDMSERGYENNSRYEIGDYEENEINFYCSNIIIKDFIKP